MAELPLCLACSLQLVPWPLSGVLFSRIDDDLPVTDTKTEMTICLYRLPKTELHKNKSQKGEGLEVPPLDVPLHIILMIFFIHKLSLFKEKRWHL